MKARSWGGGSLRPTKANAGTDAETMGSDSGGFIGVHAAWRGGSTVRVPLVSPTVVVQPCDYW